MITSRISTRARALTLVSILLPAALALACAGDGESPEPAPTVADAPPRATTAPPADREREDLGLLTSQGTVTAPSAPPPSSRAAGQDDDPLAILAPGARFTLPAAWQRQSPSSSMRLAQARVDGPGGPGQLTVFHFGAGGGGGVEQNLARWAAQVDANAEPSRESFAYDAFQVTMIEVEGTLKPSTMGTGPSSPQPDNRLLGAVIEGPGGPWYFKLTGPSATLAAARDDFVAMLRSATTP